MRPQLTWGEKKKGREKNMKLKALGASCAAVIAAISVAGASEKTAVSAVLVDETTQATVHSLKGEKYSTPQNHMLRGYEAAAAFLDAHAHDWEVQTSTFTSDYFAALKKNTANKQDTTFRLELLRLSDKYATATPMRIIGYFPNASSTRVAHLITDEAARLGWDKNYSKFAVAQHSQISDALAPELAAESLLPAVISEVPCDVDRQAQLSSSCSSINWTWACHRVSSALLQRLGVKGRYFQYERVLWRPLQRNDCFNILYRSVGDDLAQSYPSAFVSHRSRSFLQELDTFLKQHRDAADERVVMHYQAISLIPVHGQADSLEQLLSQARNAPSVSHETFREMLERHCQTVGQSSLTPHSSQLISGTLMLFTSLNETAIPSGIPKWAEKRLAHFFTSQAYEMLHRQLQQE